MIRKTISFTLIILVIFLVYQYLVTIMKDKHSVTYYINKDDTFMIDEEYKKENGNDYYLIKVTNDDKKFAFKVDNTYNKQKNIVEDIEVMEQDGYYCIGLDLVGKGNYTFPECIKDDVVYSYSNIKDKVDFKEYISNINDNELEKYSKDSSKSIESDLLINRDYFDKDEVIIVYRYKIVSLHYQNYSRSFSFSSLDNYKNTYGTLVGDYYVIPRLTSLPTFKTLIRYDVIDGVKKEIDLSVDVSKQSYINGVYDNKLYLFDVSNKRQFEIDPENDTVNIVGTIDQDGVNVVNGEKQPISVYDLEKSEVKFEGKVDTYSSIDYEEIYVGDYYSIYLKEGKYYKVYNAIPDVSILLLDDPDIHNVILKGNNLYYLKENTIYKCNDYGNFGMISGNEFIYNYDNIYDVYKK